MSERARIVLLALWMLSLSWCGYREAGLEVDLDVALPEDVVGALWIDRVELLTCPDVPAEMAWLAPAVAHAHAGPVAMGPFALDATSPRASSALRAIPGSYCDVLVHFGALGTPALESEAGTASERETVLRLVDATGAPTRLLLARAPARASIHVTLGRFSSAQRPAQALSSVIDGACATLDISARPRE